MVKQRDPAAIAEEALGVKAGRAPKKVPFAFVLDELEVLAPTTRPMFGCTAIYVGPRIVLVLRDGRGTADDGVWIATTAEHHASLRKELPSIRSITVFGPGESGWQVIPAAAESFEEEVLWACELVRRGDPRVGKLPKPKKRKSASA
ncbi:MAG: hypothetical protein IPN17_13485 [Deltaproteobacteria bacterium]|nr:hypothetical protein [Deltaproteobacteria bacterium]